MILQAWRCNFRADRPIKDLRQSKLIVDNGRHWNCQNTTAAMPDFMKAHQRREGVLRASPDQAYEDRNPLDARWCA